MLSFGLLSNLLGFINFYIPGIEGARSDLRELPLIIGIIHLSNPFYSIGMSVLTLLTQPPGGSYLSTFLMHTIALFSMWYFFNYVNNKKLTGFNYGILGFSYTFIYYFLLIIPIMILTNYLVGLNSDKSFISFYTELVLLLRYEVISTAIVIAIYYIQYRLRQELKKHKENLELIVQERTKDLNFTIKELKETQNYLVQSEKLASLGTLVSGVAHEINNPLNFISGGLNLFDRIKSSIKENLTNEMHQNYIEALTMINEGLDRSIKIVDALMTFARKGSSKFELYNLHTIIDNTILFLKHDMPDDVEIIKDYKLKNQVPIYAEKIHQVFFNILNNALFALNTVDYKKIIIKTGSNENKAFIEFENTGPFIPEENLKQLFDPFFTTKDPDKGKGLGLSICYNIIQEHHGKIVAKNTTKGVSFEIELPLQN